MKACSLPEKPLERRTIKPQSHPPHNHPLVLLAFPGAPTMCVPCAVSVPPAPGAAGWSERADCLGRILSISFNNKNTQVEGGEVMEGGGWRMEVGGRTKGQRGNYLHSAEFPSRRRESKRKNHEWRPVLWVSLLSLPPRDTFHACMCVSVSVRWCIYGRVCEVLHLLTASGSHRWLATASAPSQLHVQIQIHAHTDTDTFWCGCWRCQRRCLSGRCCLGRRVRRFDPSCVLFQLHRFSIRRVTIPNGSAFSARSAVWFLL